MNDKSIGEKIVDFATSDDTTDKPVDATADDAGDGLDDYDRQIADAMYLAVQLGEYANEYEGPTVRWQATP